MANILIIFIYAVFVIIFNYLTYELGKYKGKIEAYDECLEELENLKKFMEKRR